MADATPTRADVRIRPMDELDISDIVAIDEKIGGRYRPDVWETRAAYYLRRDPEGSLVAEADGAVIGFMLGEVRTGEFGLDETSGWIDQLGVDPDARGQAVGRRLAEAMLDHFRQLGATSVRTLVDEEMEGIRSFFASLGFEPASLRPFVRRL